MANVTWMSSKFFRDGDDLQPFAKVLFTLGGASVVGHYFWSFMKWFVTYMQSRMSKQK
jgi:hypothetical protein